MILATGIIVILGLVLYFNWRYPLKTDDLGTEGI